VLGIPRVAATSVSVVQNSHEHLSPTGELKVAGKVDRKLLAGGEIARKPRRKCLRTARIHVQSNDCRACCTRMNNRC
jgi:hypothetical protein